LPKQKPFVVSAVVLALILVFAVWMGWLSVRRFASFNASMLDIGNVTQAVWSATQGQPLVYTYITGPVSRLFIHMELFYFLLAIPYKLIPRPETLLIIQAILYAAGAWPVFCLASRRLGHSLYGFMLMLVYLVYPVAQTAVLFDVHGDTLAMPFLLFAIDAMDRNDWKGFAAAVLLAASCKLYVALAIFLLAGILWFQRKRRAALVTGLSTVVWVGFLFGLKALVSTAEPAIQTGTGSGGIAGYLSFYLSGVLDTTGLPLRLVNALVVILPAIVIGWRALPWFLAAWVFILPALMIRGQGYNYIFHHYALAVPFLIASLVYGLESLAQKQVARGTRPARVRFEMNLNTGATLVLALVSNIMLVQTPFSALYYQMPYISTSEIPARAFTPRDVLKIELLERIPDDQPVWVNSFLAPRLVERPEIYITHYEKPMTGAELQRIHDRATVFVEDIFSREVNLDALALVASSGRFWLKDARDGLFYFDTQAPGLDYSITRLAGTTDPPNVTTASSPAPGIFLINYLVSPGNDGKVQLQFDWMVRDPVDRPVMIITRIDGPSDIHIVHLPSMAILPPTRWQPGTVYREIITIPESLTPPAAELFTAWYDQTIAAVEDDAPEGQLGPEIQLVWDDHNH